MTYKMKKTMILLLLVLSGLQASAQQGLSVYPLFEGKIIPATQMIETRVAGREIAKYQLSLFRSLRFVATTEQQQKVDELVERDSKGHFVMMSNKNGVSTVMVQFPPRGSVNRFLCKKTKKKMKGGHAEIIVLYMEGALSSLAQLNEILNQTKE